MGGKEEGRKGGGGREKQGRRLGPCLCETKEESIRVGLRHSVFSLMFNPFPAGRVNVSSDSSGLVCAMERHIYTMGTQKWKLYGGRGRVPVSVFLLHMTGQAAPNTQSIQPTRQTERGYWTV